MSTHRAFDRICAVVLIVTLLLTVLMMHAESFGLQSASVVMGYESRLFATDRVHTIDIRMTDWDAFLATCENEEYATCTVVIDDEIYSNVAIRAKGNTSLTQVAAYGNDRYSFKIEFDHYDSSNTYHGLDKLCLNNLIQDNTCMKDYLCYQMMAAMNVAAPLCSYVSITVNGEAWGLYLAVEGVEEAFLQRNYGKNYGELYKPDSQSMGGGRGNGMAFDKAGMASFFDQLEKTEDSFPTGQQPTKDGWRLPNGQLGMPDAMQPNGMNGSEDVLLKYIDDAFESYTNLFDNAKTDVSDRDKTRLIAALKRLSAGESIEDTVAVEAVIRYFAVHNFVLNFDSYTGSMIHNYYLYEKDGQLQMIPWDYNLAFGAFETSMSATELINMPIDSPVSGGNVEDRPMLAWIFADDAYTALYHETLETLVTTYFESGYFETMIDAVTAMITPYVEQDPTCFCTFEDFQTAAATLKSFCLLRAESVRAQLNGTIGTTTATQEPDTLVDGGDLQVSDMGSMNHGGMGGGAFEVGGFDRLTAGDGMTPPTGDQPDGMTPPTGDQSDGMTPPTGDQPDGMTPPTGDQPDGMTPPTGDQSDGMTPPTGDQSGGMTPPTGDQPDGMGDRNNSMQRPEDGNAEPTADDASAGLYLGLSVGALLLGLLFAGLFRQRGTTRRKK